MSSFTRLTSGVVKPSFWWPGFVKDRHGSASPWAEAAGGASRQRTMRMQPGAALGRVFGFEGHAEALGVGNSSEPVSAHSPRVSLALRLRGAGCTQSGMAHWAGAAVRNGVGKAS